MNTIQSMTVALVGLGCLSPMAFAQGSAAAKVEAIVQFGAKPTKLTLSKASGAGKFSFEDKMSDQMMEGEVSKSRTFMIQTPVDFALAMRFYRAGKISSAYNRLGAAKKKYAAFAGLPFNPGTMAAIYELKTAIRLQDWAAMPALCKAFPSPRTLTKREAEFLAVAGLLAFEDAKAADALKAVQDYLLNVKTVDGLELENYGYLRYAQARAMAALLPSSELSEGELSADSAKQASLAIDYFCQAAMAQRGANKEMIADCMTRAAKLLYAMPGVKAYAPKLDGMGLEVNWKKAPNDLKDAAAMAYLIMGMYPSETPDPVIAQLARYYYNPNAAK